MPLNPTSSFTSYSRLGFGEAEQRRLAETVGELSKRGCFVMSSNSDTPLVRTLYADYRLIEVQARRNINSKANKRGPITELLILTF